MTVAVTKRRCQATVNRAVVRAQRQCRWSMSQSMPQLLANATGAIIDPTIDPTIKDFNKELSDRII